MECVLLHEIVAAEEIRGSAAEIQHVGVHQIAGKSFINNLCRKYERKTLTILVVLLEAPRDLDTISVILGKGDIVVVVMPAITTGRRVEGRRDPARRRRCCVKVEEN